MPAASAMRFVMSFVSWSGSIRLLYAAARGDVTRSRRPLTDDDHRNGRGQPPPNRRRAAVSASCTLPGPGAERAVVVEDALSGVAAGHDGDFGLVIGVDRGVGADRLLQAGADVVVADLAELVVADAGESVTE